MQYFYVMQKKILEYLENKTRCCILVVWFFKLASYKFTGKQLTVLQRFK